MEDFKGGRKYGKRSQLIRIASQHFEITRKRRKLGKI
jgi:hypothetical protein